MRNDVDVLIVGAGIAGPALAAALAPHGVRVAILEREVGPLDTARGDHLQPRAVEILERWGALDQLRDRGAERRAGTIWFDHTGEPLVRAMLAEGDLPHPYFLYLNHERINEALMAAAATNRNLVVHRPISGWKLVSRSDSEAVVEVDHGDRTETIRSSVLVGADGQNSRLRHAVGIEAEVYRYRRPLVVFFARYTDQPEGNVLTAHIGPAGIVAVVPRTDGWCKIGVASDPDALAGWRQLDAPAIEARLGEMAAGLPITALEHVGVYPPVRVTAERWVEGNVVLLGDACHAMHPAQSQGMNVSIRCADALADAIVGADGDHSSALAAFEQATRPMIEPVLDANHQAGSLFDTTDPGPIAGFTTMLRGMGASEAATRGYAITSAGYPPPSTE